MKNIKKILMFSLLIIIACSPDQFYLNDMDPDIKMISCLKVSPLESVEVITNNAFMLYEDGRVDMKCNQTGVTQLKADFTLELKQGRGINFSLRSVTEKHSEHSSVTFDYTTNGSVVYENNIPIVHVDSIKAFHNTASRIMIENYGNLINIVINCDTLFYGRTNIPATEYIIVKSIDKTQALFSGIVFSDMNADVKAIDLNDDEN